MNLPKRLIFLVIKLKKITMLEKHCFKECRKAITLKTTRWSYKPFEAVAVLGVAV